MDGIALQAESHQHGLNAQNLFEIADDGDASSAAYSQRFLTEGLLETFLGCLIGR